MQRAEMGCTWVTKCETNCCALSLFASKFGEDGLDVFGKRGTGQSAVDGHSRAGGGCGYFADVRKLLGLCHAAMPHIGLPTQARFEYDEYEATHAISLLPGEICRDSLTPLMTLILQSHAQSSSRKSLSSKIPRLLATMSTLGRAASATPGIAEVICTALQIAATTQLDAKAGDRSYEALRRLPIYDHAGAFTSKRLRNRQPDANGRSGGHRGYCALLQGHGPITVK